jgi:hypothetical protein
MLFGLALCSLLALVWLSLGMVCGAFRVRVR